MYLSFGEGWYILPKTPSTHFGLLNAHPMSFKQWNELKCQKRVEDVFCGSSCPGDQRASVTISNLAPAAGPRLDRDKRPITLLLPPTCSSPQMQNMIIMTITITRTVVKTYNLPSHQKFHFLMEVSISSGFIILSHHRGGRAAAAGWTTCELEPHIIITTLILEKFEGGRNNGDFSSLYRASVPRVITSPPTLFVLWLTTSVSPISQISEVTESGCM